jgi:hypothetical protein
LFIWDITSNRRINETTQCRSRSPSANLRVCFNRDCRLRHCCSGHGDRSYSDRSCLKRDSTYSDSEWRQ